MTAAKKPLFITLEGGEGAGKSTAIKYLQQQLCRLNVDVLTTREPGGTLIAEQIREILLKKQTESLTSATELLLVFAGRAQHIANVIRPALAKGQWVICDRFTDASFAYQGGGRGVSWSMIEALEQFVQEGLQPDVTILLDAPPHLGLKRIRRRAELDRIEAEKIDFFKRVREAYLERAKQDPNRFIIIDTSKSLATVKRDLLQLVEQWIKAA